MPRINANQAEQKYRVARMTVGRWIKAGKIAADADGYVDEDELRALLEAKKAHATIAEQGVRQPAVAPDPKKKRLSRPAVAPPSPAAAVAAAKPGAPSTAGQKDPLAATLGGDTLRGSAAGIERPDSGVAMAIKEEDRKWKRYRALNAKLLYEEKKLRTLRTEAVIHAFGQIKSALDPLRTYGEREGAALLAFARDPATTEAAMTARLNQDHDRIGRDIIAAVSRQLSALKKESKEAADAEAAAAGLAGAPE